MSDSDTTTATATATASAHAASLPDGWRPWQTKLRYDLKGVLSTTTALDAWWRKRPVLWRYGFHGRQDRRGLRPHPVADRHPPSGAQPIGVRDGLVYMYEEPDEKTRRMVALDAGTGHRRWQRDINPSEEAVLYDGGLLTLSPDYSSFVAYGPSGKELWRAPSLDEYCTPSALGGAPTPCARRATSPARPRSS